MKRKLLSVVLALMLVLSFNLVMAAPAAAVLNLGIASGAGGNTLDSVDTTDGTPLLQFTSGGHVLGFREDGILVAAASHMLKIDFLNSRAVAPEADGTASQESSIDQASPLGRVTYRNVWDGVTLIYEASEASIVKSTYYVDITKEGVQVDCIRLGYNRPVQIDKKGNLVISYENGAIVEAAPVAWQEVEGQRKPVTAAFALYGAHEVGFCLDDFVPGIPLVIDPALTWNTFLGGGATDKASAIAVDSSGNVYVSGWSSGTWGSPVRAYTPGLQLGYEGFAAKLNGTTGALIWNTFMGGNNHDFCTAIAVDSSGSIYVGGYSHETWGSPVRAYTPGGQWGDAFAAKLNSTTGALTWNTFLGGSSHDEVRAIAVDSNGNVYVGGYSNATWGSPVRAHTPSDDAPGDAFAAKLNSNGSLVWNTFLGSNRHDVCNAITVDISGNVYVGGYSWATWGSPVRAYTTSLQLQYEDAFAAKLNGTTGALTWNTFLGGSGNERGHAIAVDGSGNVYIGGYGWATWGSPLRAFSSGCDAFTAKLNGTTGALIWHTFLGGSGNDLGYAIAVEGNGNVYVGGYSAATWSDPERAYKSLVGDGYGYDAFAARLDSSGSLQWNTFLGGISDDYGWAIAVDGSGNVYVGGYSSATWGSPVLAYSFGDDAFVAKLGSGSGSPSTSIAVPTVSPSPQSTATPAPSSPKPTSTLSPIPTPAPTPSGPPSTPVVPPSTQGGTVLPTPPYGQPEPKTGVSGMTLQAGQRRVVAGSLISVPVWLINSNNVANSNFELRYEAKVAQPEGTILKGSLLDNALFTANPNESGIIRAGFAATTGVSGTGTVAIIPFRAVGQVGDRTPLILSVTKINDPGGGSLSIYLIYGEILIVGPDGLVPGDCDGDGWLSALDALCALEMSVRLRPEKLSLDMDADRQVTSRDSVMILKSIFIR